MDHLVFAAPDLDAGVRYIEALFGVDTQPGGQHLGLGTRNRLVGFGSDMYMEVVGIDPEQPAPDKERWFGLDHLAEARLVTWCAKSPDLDGLVERGTAAGIDVGMPIAGGRRRPDGGELRWTFTDPWAERGQGVIPFFIDWGDTEHPARALPASCSFVGLRVEHPDPDLIARWMGQLDLDTPVGHGHAPRVVATIDTPNGIVELS